MLCLFLINFKKVDCVIARPKYTRSILHSVMVNLTFSWCKAGQLVQAEGRIRVSENKPSSDNQSESVLTYCKLESQEQTSLSFQSKCNSFHSFNGINSKLLSVAICLPLYVLICFSNGGDGWSFSIKTRTSRSCDLINWLLWNNP